MEHSASIATGNDVLFVEKKVLTMAEYIEKGIALYSLRNLAKEPAYQHDGEDYYVGICEASGVINEIQPADVAPVRHGRWIEHDDGVFTCSECGNAESNESYFCRYCGAKMDGDW